jgi:branched-subunit amino acid ABC-type transport system permease component
MGGVTGLDGSGFDRGAGLIGHQFIAGTKKPAHGGLVCLAGYAYGCMASSITVIAYMIGSAINAPAMALIISSLVMLVFPRLVMRPFRGAVSLLE